MSKTIFCITSFEVWKLVSNSHVIIYKIAISCVEIKFGIKLQGTSTSLLSAPMD